MQHGEAKCEENAFNYDNGIEPFFMRVRKERE